MAGITAIAIMTFLNLAVVASAVSGARDQEISVLRLDSVRAFYACEAAMNLAVREVMTSTDSDGNGAVGGIANRTLSGATASATAAGSAPVTITANGALRDARRRLQANVQ